MIGTLDDWRVLMSPGAAPLREAMPPEPSPGVIERFRGAYPPGVVTCAAELARARRSARQKLPEDVARSLVGDRPGVEMASSWAAAAWKARRATHLLPPTSPPVLDLCCGIGADAMALCAAGLGVRAIDIDPVRAWMAGLNAPAASARCADAEAVDVSGAIVHADPARRTASGTRTVNLADLVPGPAFVEKLGRTCAGGVIKLHPGVDADELPEGVRSGELEVLSEDGTLTQALAWFGVLAPALGLRRATLLKRVLTDRAAADSAVDAALSIAGPPAPQDDAVDDGRIGSWVFVADPGPERVGLLPALCEQQSVRLVHPGTGLLTADEHRPSAWLRAFEVLDAMAWNERRVRAALASLGAGVVEVKTRDRVVDPDRLQRTLRGRGERPVTVFVLRFGTAVRAVLAERLGPRTPTQAAATGH